MEQQPPTPSEEVLNKGTGADLRAWRGDEPGTAPPRSQGNFLGPMLHPQERLKIFPPRNPTAQREGKECPNRGRQGGAGLSFGSTLLWGMRSRGQMPRPFTYSGNSSGQENSHIPLIVICTSLAAPYPLRLSLVPLKPLMRLSLVESMSCRFMTWETRSEATEQPQVTKWA